MSWFDLDLTDDPTLTFISLCHEYGVGKAARMFAPNLEDDLYTIRDHIASEATYSHSAIWIFQTSGFYRPGPELFFESKALNWLLFYSMLEVAGRMAVIPTQLPAAFVQEARYEILSIKPGMSDSGSRDFYERIGFPLIEAFLRRLDGKDSVEHGKADTQASLAPSSSIGEEFETDVAKKSFELFERRRGTNGDELSDWLEAEKLVKHEMLKKAFLRFLIIHSSALYLPDMWLDQQAERWENDLYEILDSPELFVRKFERFYAATQYNERNGIPEPQRFVYKLCMHFELYRNLASLIREASVIDQNAASAIWYHFKYRTDIMDNRHSKEGKRAVEMILNSFDRWALYSRDHEASKEVTELRGALSLISNFPAEGHIWY